MNTINFSFLKSGVFWSNAVTVAYLFFGAVLNVYPSVTWINSVVVALNFILTQYFHKSAVLGAAASSAALGKPVSGQ